MLDIKNERVRDKRREETNEQKKVRLAKRNERDRDRARRAAECSEQRDSRFERKHQRPAKESSEDRAARYKIFESSYSVTKHWWPLLKSCQPS